MCRLIRLRLYQIAVRRAGWHQDLERLADAEVRWSNRKRMWWSADYASWWQRRSRWHGHRRMLWGALQRLLRHRPSPPCI